MPRKNLILLVVCVIAGVSFYIMDLYQQPSPDVSANRKDTVNIDQQAKPSQLAPVTKTESTGASNVSIPNSANLQSIEQLANASVLEESAATQDNKVARPVWVSGSSISNAKDETPEQEYPITVNQEVFANLQVGQKLEFFIPQLGQVFTSKVNDTYNQLGGVKVWKGVISGEEPNNSNFIMTQGKVMTNVALTTASGVFNVQIDNKTGAGVVIDDREYSSRLSDIDDAVPFNPEQAH